jgi:hypothetical protein
MTIQSWKDEFMPKRAKECTGSNEVALKHASKKWSGLTQEMLRKHGLTAENSVLRDWNKETFVINNASCALCEMYIDCHKRPVENNCPLIYVRDNRACDNALSTEEHSPWWIWVEFRDPEPMISLINKALAEELKEAGGITCR